MAAYCRHLETIVVMLMLTAMLMLKMDLDVSAGIFGGQWSPKRIPIEVHGEDGITFCEGDY